MRKAHKCRCKKKGACKKKCRGGYHGNKKCGGRIDFRDRRPSKKYLTKRIQAISKSQKNYKPKPIYLPFDPFA